MFLDSPDMARFKANDRYERLLDEANTVRIARQAGNRQPASVAYTLLTRLTSSLGDILIDAGAAIKYRTSWRMAREKLVMLHTDQRLVI